jgi:2-polyprenyl-3-methyl-5-hydroxy-6-metoxy-1,4-benzoquinol methylase
MRDYTVYKKYQQGAIHTSERRDVAPFLPSQINSWLDIGCGSGGFGATILEKSPDIELCGVEPNQEQGKVASSFFDKVYIEEFSKNLSDKIGDKKFDGISLLDVLEHLLWPEDMLKLISPHIEEDGVVIASIPNIMYFEVLFREIIMNGDWQYKISGTLDYTHFRFFTYKSMIRLFEENGYKVKSIDGINKCNSKLFKVLNFVTFGFFKHWGYLQYVIVAKKS